MNEHIKQLTEVLQVVECYDAQMLIVKRILAHDSVNSPRLVLDLEKYFCRQLKEMEIEDMNMGYRKKEKGT